MHSVLLLAAVVFSSCFATAGQSQSSQQQPTIELPPALARVLTDYESAWSRRDPAALAQLFAEDGYVLPSGQLPVKGRVAIEHHYTGSGGPLSLRAIAFAAEGSVGYIIGGFAEKKGDPDVGKFTLTLRKDKHGRWLIVSDMDNPNQRQRSNQPAS